ncbi:hypothetical protein HJG43_08235 [Kineosporiaceae bacterium SCSIO 59966]|nr:hypothetical protein HJG43_08235 [Kineosporiaceae bacterium SCSIO 59966]
MPGATENRTGGSGPPWWAWPLMLVLFGLAGYLLFALVRAIIEAFSDAGPEVAAALLTGATTVLVAVLSVLLTRFFERRNAREREQQQKRTPVYEEFIAGLLESLGFTKTAEERKEGMDQAEVARVLGNFTKQAVVWGSDDVIRAWVDYRYATMKMNPKDLTQGRQGMRKLEELFLTIRKDLGLSNKSLRDGDLLRLFINDLDSGEGAEPAQQSR